MEKVENCSNIYKYIYGDGALFDYPTFYTDTIKNIFVFYAQLTSVIFFICYLELCTSILNLFCNTLLSLGVHLS
jgi:hypothetical protein